MIGSARARHALGVLAALAALDAVTACDRANRPRTDFPAEAAMRYAKAQLDFGPRIPGSLGARRAGDWIIQEMRRRADTVIVQSFTHVTAARDTLPLRNILARFQPAATERVLYITHWDTRPISDAPGVPASQRQTPVPGANDGASGVGLFVALGDLLKKTRPTVGVDLLFVDGEDYGSFDPPPCPAGKSCKIYGPDVLIGSQWFATHPPDAEYRPLYGVLWDMIGDADLLILQEGNSVQRAPEVVARVWSVASELGYGRFFSQNVTTVTDDHVPLLDAGLRVIDVIDIDYPPHHTPQDTFDKISRRSLQIVGDVAAALVTR